MHLLLPIRGVSFAKVMEIATNLFTSWIILFLVLVKTVGATSAFPYSCPSPTASRCSNNLTQDQRVPLYILVLVPFPDEREEAGLDFGLATLPGVRIARDFINCDQSELLPGYRIEIIESNHEACGILETIQETYISLARFALHQECGPVVAVAGLLCSPSTAIASHIAGHDGTDIIQLSASGSPAFDWNFTTYTRFSLEARPLWLRDYPRLWRYVSSAAIYVDTLLALMEEFEWKNVGLVQDLQSVYFIAVAEDFRKKIEARSTEFKLISTSGLEQTDPQYITVAVQNIKRTGVRIIFVPATFAQSTLLICRAAYEGLISPLYQWVFIDMYIQDFEDQSTCNPSMLHKGLNGSFLLQYKLESVVADITKDSSAVIQEYFSLYKKHLRDIQRDFNFSRKLTSDPGSTYSTLLFDQVWSYAHALNQSLPQLQSGNLSLVKYTNGNVIADIIEDQLSKLNIQGLNGNIRFNGDRVFPSTVRIVHAVFVNKTAISGTVVGTYTNSTGLQNLSLNASDVPADFVDPQLIMLPTAGGAIIYLTILTVLILVTINLVSFLLFRKKPVVKASSPYLSLFMFVGCYLLCSAALLQITNVVLGDISVTKLDHAFLCGAGLLIDQNGYIFISVALFIKLLRLHHIFTNKYLRNLSGMWKNSSLAFIVIILCLVQNILSISIIAVLKLSYRSRLLETKNKNGVRLEQRVVSCNTHRDLLYTISYLPLVVYFILITYLAITMRRIKNRNFKDTKKVNLFVAVVAVLMVAYIVSWWFLLATNMEQFIVIVQTLFPLAVAMACQAILFLPKVLPTWWSELKTLHLSSTSSVTKKSGRTSVTELLS